MPLSEVAGHAGTMATGVGDPGAAHGGKCCHWVTARVASSSAHLCYGCGPHLARACCTSCAWLPCALRRHPLAHGGSTRSCCRVSSVQHHVLLALYVNYLRGVLGLCVAVCGSHSQLKKGCSFDITIPCRSSIRHLAFLCSR